jgi:hypothetical protein
VRYATQCIDDRVALERSVGQTLITVAAIFQLNMDFRDVENTHLFCNAGAGGHDSEGSGAGRL